MRPLKGRQAWRKRARGAWLGLPARERKQLAGWCVLVGVLSLVGLGVSGRLHHTDISIEGSRGTAADALAARAFGATNTGLVLLKGPPAVLDRDGPAVAAALRRIPHVRVLAPWPTPSSPLRPGRDRALLLLEVAEPYEQATQQADPQIRSVLQRVVHPPLASHVTGYIDIGNQVYRESVKAIERAELIAAPLLLIILLLVLGSPIAAALPLGLGGAVVAASTGALSLLNQVHPVDIAALNLASMMGLALGVDYALLLLTRFREELAAGSSVDDAVRRTSATAGRTVRFAGIVLGSVMAASLLLQPGSVLSSGVAGTLIALALSMLGAALGMPALLRLTGTHINRLMLVPGAARSDRWGAAALRLIRRPGLAIGLVGLLLVALAVPALGMQTGPPNPLLLPRSTQARQDFDVIRRDVNGGWGAPYQITFVARRGAITSPARLRALAGFQRRLASDPRVFAVLGPGELAGRTARLSALPGQLRAGGVVARKGSRGLARMDGGAGKVAQGVHELLAGVGSAGRAARRLDSGAGRASAGGARLVAGLAQARAGAARLETQLPRLIAGTASLRRGQRRLSEGVARLGSGIATMQRSVARARPAAGTLADHLRTGANGLSALASPADLADEKLAQAVRQLDAMLPTSRADPRYAQVYASVVAAAAAISGRDPRTGNAVRPGYRGLPAELRAASAEGATGARGAGAIAAGLGSLARGLATLRRGAAGLRRGAQRLQRGTARLAAGGERASGASRALAAGVASSSAGAGRLERGHRELSVGSAALASGLAGAAKRSRPLAAGSQRLHTGAHQAAQRTGALSARLAGVDRLEPVLRSGYAVAAALDSAPSAQRQRAASAVNLDRGANAVRFVVVQRDVRLREPNPFREHLHAIAQDLARRTGTQAGVGGPAADLTDFDGVTRARLPLLIAAIIVVTYLALVPVLRSLLLPLVAVVLNLLTVLASFGVLSLAFSGAAPLGGPGFVDDIMVMSVFTIVFALSIDYEVFLLSRMREGWELTGTTDGAIAHGLRHTAGVITGAAAIMTGVFVAFASSPVINLRELGVGLSVAVVLDATVIRLVLLPAALRLVGDRAWTLPAWLGRRLPALGGDGPPIPISATDAFPREQPLAVPGGTRVR